MVPVSVSNNKRFFTTFRPFCAHKSFDFPKISDTPYERSNHPREPQIITATTVSKSCRPFGDYSRLAVAGLTKFHVYLVQYCSIYLNLFRFDPPTWPSVRRKPRPNSTVPVCPTAVLPTLWPAVSTRKISTRVIEKSIIQNMSINKKKKTHGYVITYRQYILWL